MQGEHGRLAGAADKDQCHGPCQCRCSHKLRRNSLLENGAIPRCERAEIKGLCIVGEYQDADQEKHIGKAGHDKCFFGGRHGSRLCIIEADEQVGGDAHQLPEDVHLKNIGRQHQSQHRESKEREEGVVTLESFFSLHVTQTVDMHHQRDGGDHHQHHHRNRVEQDPHIDMQIGSHIEPEHVQRYQCLKNSPGFLCNEILACCVKGEQCYNQEACRSDHSRFLVA